jgi:hypothetical protein
MQRLGTLAVLSLTLFACQDAPTPPTESFQFPMAVFVQGKPNDFWDAVLNGMRQRLNLPGVQLETVFFTAAEREGTARRVVEGDWRAVAFCAPNDAWAKQTVEQAIQEGVPVVLVGADLPNTTRLGYVSTYYYDAGRRAGIWYAQRVSAGEIVVVAGHPVPCAVSEFWEGFRHGLLFNRRLTARLIPLSDSRNAPVGDSKTGIRAARAGYLHDGRGSRPAGNRRRAPKKFGRTQLARIGKGLVSRPPDRLAGFGASRRDWRARRELDAQP